MAHIPSEVTTSLSASTWKQWRREEVAGCDLRVRYMENGCAIIRARIGPAKTGITVYTIGTKERPPAWQDALRARADEMDRLET